ncbi:MAG: hypothetical protein WCL27_12935 [Betaproteobacteria bacterium]
MAEDLCEIKAHGRAAEALARREELHVLRNTLLDQLKLLVHESQQQSRN